MRDIATRRHYGKDAAAAAKNAPRRCCRVFCAAAPTPRRLPRNRRVAVDAASRSSRCRMHFSSQSRCRTMPPVRQQPPRRISAIAPPTPQQRRRRISFRYAAVDCRQTQQRPIRRNMMLSCCNVRCHRSPGSFSLRRHFFIFSDFSAMLLIFAADTPFILPLRYFSHFRHYAAAIIFYATGFFRQMPPRFQPLFALPPFFSPAAMPRCHDAPAVASDTRDASALCQPCHAAAARCYADAAFDASCHAQLDFHYAILMLFLRFAFSFAADAIAFFDDATLSHASFFFVRLLPRLLIFAFFARFFDAARRYCRQLSPLIATRRHCPPFRYAGAAVFFSSFALRFRLFMIIDLRSAADFRHAALSPP